MKPNFKFALVLSLFALLFLNSCQNEVTEVTDNQEEAFDAQSTVANLMRSAASNDGSVDDILDDANCFSVNLPVTIIVNDITITINSLEDLEIIEDIFSEFDDDEDILEFLFPITIILNDYTEYIIENIEQLESFIEECTNVEDDVIECVDFVYPISFSLYNSDFQIIDTVVIDNDEALYDFLEELEENPGGAVLASLNFPVSLVYANGTVVEVNSNQELEAALLAAEEECDDEDDSCDAEEVTMYLTECFWNVYSFNGDNVFGNYDIYFNEDGTLDIINGDTTVAIGGLWELSETDAGLVLTLSELTAFDEDLGGDWVIIECEDDYFKLIREDDVAGNADYIQLERDCDEDIDCSPQEIAINLQECQWWAGSNTTPNGFQGVLQFSPGNVVVTTSDGATYTGSWALVLTDEGIFLILELPEPADSIAGEWMVIECDADRIKLVNGDAYLVLEQDCSDVYDCVELQANVGDECTTDNGNVGFINENCECQPQDEFDCPDFEANVGDICETPDGVAGELNENCECVTNSDFDCPDLQANFGDVCETADGQPGFINENCDCEPNNTFDCPDYQANVGDPCENPNGVSGVLDENCNCVTDTTFDCPDLQQNFGDQCETANGAVGYVNENCECEVPNYFECFSNVELVVCDDNVNDGISEFDLNLAFPNCPTDEVEWTFHETLADAETGTNPISSPYTNTTNPQTIYVRVQLAGDPETYEVFEVHLFVEDCSQPCGVDAVYDYVNTCEWVPVSVDGSNDFSNLYFQFTENGELIIEGNGTVETGFYQVTGNPADGTYILISGFNSQNQIFIGEWLVAQCTPSELILLNNASNSQVILEQICF